MSCGYYRAGEGRRRDLFPVQNNIRLFPPLMFYLCGWCSGMSSINTVLTRGCRTTARAPCVKWTFSKLWESRWDPDCGWYVLGCRHWNTPKARFVCFQLSADCLDDIPPDYETSVGGPPTNPISAASEITVNESSVALDPGVRTTGFQQLYANALTEAPAEEGSHIIDSSKSCPNKNY